ncbi:hypothetical protein AB4144_61510, partial [Rhizobiaceae sp. 2RAB30]
SSIGKTVKSLLVDPPHRSAKMSKPRKISAPLPRKGSPSPRLDKAEFLRRCHEQYHDPAFDAVRPELERIAEVAWQNYSASNKSPVTRKAGPEFFDPDYD